MCIFECMYVCMYICMHVYMYVCMYVYQDLELCMHMAIHVPICIYRHEYACTSSNVHMHAIRVCLFLSYMLGLFLCLSRGGRGERERERFIQSPIISDVHTAAAKNHKMGISHIVCVFVGSDVRRSCFKLVASTVRHCGGRLQSPLG